MRATVDHDLCIGDAICESICPQVFQLGDDGLSYVIADPIPEDLRAEVEEAVESCPTDAIAIHDDNAAVDAHLLKSIKA